MRFYFLFPTFHTIVLFSSVVNKSEATDDNYAYCGTCECIVTDGDSCPSDVPPKEFTPEYEEFLKSLEVLNPYELYCNPYQDDDCETTPPQPSDLMALGDTAACGLVYEIDNNCPTKYNLVSYASVDELESDGAVLTHHGACGVCSTTQDLAVYIEYPNLVDKGVECSIRSLANFTLGVQCYVEVGYTEPCATMWVYNGHHTRDNCLEVCLRFNFEKEPYSGPPPECKIADCLQCDEEESGPFFQKVAARSRRRSGLLSHIARPCDDILLVEHNNEPSSCDDDDYYPIEKGGKKESKKGDNILGGSSKKKKGYDSGRRTR